MAYSLLTKGLLKSHFYNLVPGAPQLNDFHQFYCEYLQLSFREMAGFYIFGAGYSTIYLEISSFPYRIKYHSV